jgi:hypothetical protein
VYGELTYPSSMSSAVRTQQKREFKSHVDGPLQTVGWERRIRMLSVFVFAARIWVAALAAPGTLGKVTFPPNR